MILDSICVFVTNNVSSTYASAGEQIFDTAKSFSDAVTECMPKEIDRTWLQSIAAKVNGGSEDQKESLMDKVQDASIASDMLPFFPFIKILLKLIELGMTIARKSSLERQLENLKKSQEDSQIELEKLKAIEKNLDFRYKLKDEINRTKKKELAALDEKLKKSEEILDELKRAQVRDADAFMRNYFAELE